MDASNAQMIGQYIGKKDWAALSSFCEEMELEGAAYNRPCNENSYVLQLVSLLILDDALNARFCWKRIPEGLKKNSAALGATAKLVQSTWDKDWKTFFDVLDKANFGSKEAQVCVAALREAARDRNATLITRSYSSIGVDVAATWLGLDAKATLDFAQKSKWGVDAKAGVLFPPEVSLGKDHAVTRQQLDQLTAYMTHLEEKPVAQIAPLSAEVFAAQSASAAAVAGAGAGAGR